MRQRISINVLLGSIGIAEAVRAQASIDFETMTADEVDRWLLLHGCNFLFVLEVVLQGVPRRSPAMWACSVLFLAPVMQQLMLDLHLEPVHGQPPISVTLCGRSAGACSQSM